MREKEIRRREWGEEKGGEEKGGGEKKQHVRVDDRPAFESDEASV